MPFFIYTKTIIFFQLESCLPRPEILNGYQSLCDASIFHAVWRNIDPEPQFYPQPLTDLDEATIPNVRAKNFDNVIRNMRALYEEELGQTILVVPDCMTLGHAPGLYSYIIHFVCLKSEKNCSFCF